MRLLVTGANGLLGRHVVQAALANGHEVVAATRAATRFGDDRLAVIDGVDLGDPARLTAAVREAAPDAVVHLAGFANVGWSHREPATAIAVNTAGAAALLTAVAAEAPAARVVLASTSEVYGRSLEPLRETDPLAPESPYGQSKAWMEDAAAYFRVRHGVSIGIVRSFAHAGPGQAPAFALSNFARQVAEAQLAGRAEIEIRTGRKTTIRDLSDARDAARAYLAMAGAGPGRSADLGRSSGPGRSASVDGPVNIGSGVGRTTGDLVAAVAQAAGVAVDHVEDPSLVRDGENPAIVADISLAREALGWRPETTLEQTAADAVAWWTATLRDDPARGSGVFG